LISNPFVEVKKENSPARRKKDSSWSREGAQEENAFRTIKWPSPISTIDSLAHRSLRKASGRAEEKKGGLRKTSGGTWGVEKKKGFFEKRTPREFTQSPGRRQVAGD